MTDRTVAEKDSSLSELLDRVMDGEGLVITRDGEPVAELKPVFPKEARQAVAPASVDEDDGFLKMLREIPQHIKDAAVADVRAVRGEDDE